MLRLNINRFIYFLFILITLCGCTGSTYKVTQEAENKIRLIKNILLYPVRFVNFENDNLLRMWEFSQVLLDSVINSHIYADVAFLGPDSTLKLIGITKTCLPFPPTSKNEKSGYYLTLCAPTNDDIKNIHPQADALLYFEIESYVPSQYFRIQFSLYDTKSQSILWQDKAFEHSNKKISEIASIIFQNFKKKCPIFTSSDN